MTADVVQLLSAVLADLDRVHQDLARVAANVEDATDTLEATRVSLGALRGAVSDT